MKFTETSIRGSYIIKLEKYEDNRGYFARNYCRNEYREHGLLDSFVQSNISFNKKKGTLRGMHYQAKPYGEVKVVSCLQGAIYDVIIDLRRDSESFCKWLGITLSSTNDKMLYIPEGFAHGFQTLEDNTLVHYQMGEYYYPEYARGVRWNDPLFDIQWPLKVEVVSKKDSSYPDFKK